MKVAYFVHNLEDAAVARRVAMLQQGGCEVIVVGFWRTDARKPMFSAPILSLGKCFDGRLVHRVMAVARASTERSLFKKALRDADVVIARNLDMLLIAARARSAAGCWSPLVYECLDVHRSMLGSGSASRLMRALERTLLKRCSLLIVSSPAFEREYFRKVQELRAPVLVLENKMAALGQEAPHRLPCGPPPPSTKPWRIGWFGIIRCRKSLDFLVRLTQENPGLVEVVIRGRIAPGVFDDFHATVATSSGLSYLGAYGPGDLARMYSEVHFTWAVDFYEEGLNSVWLLPNRLYEGSAFGSVPIALNDVETGAWLRDKEAGLLVGSLDEAAKILRAMDADQYATLRAAVGRIPPRALIMDRDDCIAFVQALRALTPEAAPQVEPIAN